MLAWWLVDLVRASEGTEEAGARDAGGTMETGTGQDAGDEGRKGMRASVRWWALVIVVVGSGVVAWRTSSVATAIELVTILALLLGLGVAFGTGARRPRRGSSMVPPGRTTPDARLATRAAQTLDGIDHIEHRRLEIGRPWPQLLVGPTGATVVDLCPVESEVELDRTGVRDRGGSDGRPCSRCQDALGLAGTVRDVLSGAGLELPVRTVAVVGDDTRVTIRPDAPDDVNLVRVDRLADALARGPVFAMGMVDAAFQQLTRTVTSQRPSSR